MNNRQLFVGTVLGLLTACNAKPDAADPQKVMAEIAKVEEAQSIALSRNDLDKAISIFADDTTIYLPERSPAIGLDAIKALHLRVLKDPAFRVVIDEPSRKTWVAASGDLATTTYRSSWTHTDPRSGKPITEPLVSQTTWQRQTDGSWKNVSDINSVYRELPH